LKQLLLILCLGVFISCSEKEETNNTCFDAFFAGSKDCNANYFDTSPEPSLQTDSCNFDINGDDQKDISFVPEIGGAPYREWLHADQTLFYLNVSVKMGSNCYIHLNDSNEPDTVSYGQLFKGLKNWNNSNSQYTISSFKRVSEFNELTGPVNKNYYSGAFYNTKNKYLLIKLSLKNDTTLAWFNLSCSDEGYLKITEYACIKK
jgi:hypothetical protein